MAMLTAIGRRILLAAVCILCFVPISSAQTFGGSPPWGSEKPVRIKGEVREGISFEQEIGGGLFLHVSWMQDGFSITVSAKDSDINLTRCATPPFHGPHPTEIRVWHFVTKENSPGGVGDKRWFRFTLTPEDQEIECRNLEKVLYIYDENNPEHRRGQRELGAHVSGSGWLKVTSVKLGDTPPGTEPTKIVAMTFEAECALHGAWELWRLPARYVIPDDFNGWITVYYNQKAAPKLPVANNLYTVIIDKSAVVRTSSYLRSDTRDARFVSTNGKPLSIEGKGRSVQCWVADSDKFQTFYVGTSEDRKRTPNPILQGQVDCPE